MYKLIGAVRSRAFRPLWALEELGQPYELIAAAPQSDLARAHNPLGKIPVLVDGTDALTDSVAIMTYLADKHGGLTALAGTAARARQDAMTCWLLEEFDALLWSAAKHTRIYPEADRVPGLPAAMKTDFERNADTFAGMIAGPFVMGDTFTIADILAVHCLNWAVGAEFPMHNETVKTYAKAMRARPAFRAVRALDNG